jgi:predicted permease
MSTRKRRWWRGARTDADFQAEIQSHLDLEADGPAADGLTPDEARHAAHRAFGNRTRVAERHYEAGRWIWVEQLRQDVRYAVRTLWRSRTFVATTVATLAIALGLVTVLFAVFNAYVLRPFGIPDPYRIYQLAWLESTDDNNWRFTWREYLEARDRSDLFDGAAAHRFQMLRNDERLLYASFVSGNYFATLRPRVRLGRPLAEFDAATAGGAPVAVLSDQGWAMLFDRDPDVLGRRIELHGQQIEIVGVLGPEYAGLDDSALDLWLPITMLPLMTSTDLFGASQPREVTIFARLRHGVTEAQANEALTPFMARAAAASAEGGRTIPPGSVRAAINQRATPNPLTFELIAILSPIFAAFGLVLVAACANVSSVMLARALGRQREIGIRLSVGASRGRIVRQLLTEAAIIAMCAGAAGLGIAALVLPAGRAMFLRTLPPAVAGLARVVPLDLDFRVFGFALAVAAVATMACALLPALQGTRLQLTAALRGDVVPRVRSGILRNLLVVGQVAASIILLIAAATLTRNGAMVAATDLGFDTGGVFSINERGSDSSRIPAAARALEAEVGPEHVAVTSSNPLFGGLGKIATTAADRPSTITASYIFVSPEYFPVLRIPLRRGRAFTGAEAQAEAHVAIVSERTAQLFWPGADPIGGVLRFVPGPDSQADALKGYSEVTVVGVARDVVSEMAYQGTDATLVYLPTSRTGAHANALLVRGVDTSAAERERLARVLERVDANGAALEMLPLREMTDIALYPLRVASWIGSLLGAIALALSVSGLYGLLMYVFSQRTREIGIRMALGATAAVVVRLVMRQSARVVAIGAGLGLAFAFAALKLLSTVVTLRNVSLLDPLAFAAGIGLIGAAAAAASFFPARRAAAIDPSTTLRAE